MEHVGRVLHSAFGSGERKYAGMPITVFMRSPNDIYGIFNSLCCHVRNDVSRGKGEFLLFFLKLETFSFTLSLCWMYSTPDDCSFSAPNQITNTALASALLSISQKCSLKTYVREFASVFTTKRQTNLLQTLSTIKMICANVRMVIT